MSNRLEVLTLTIAALASLVCLGCSRGAGNSPIAIEPSLPALTDEIARGMVGEISLHVAQIRGLEFKQTVPARVVDDVEMRNYMLERLDAFDQRTQLLRTGVVYRLLGLIPEDADLLEMLLDVLEEQVGGFYDPTEGAYFLMADVPLASAPVYTAHELTHALEDQHFDLDGRIRAAIENDDHSFAVSAMHEGSATLLMNSYTVGAVQRGELDTQGLMEVSRLEADKMQTFREMPEVLQRQLLGPYLLGALFLAKGNMVAAAMNFPREELKSVMEQGPISSEQILHPEKFWETPEPPLPVSIAALGSILGEGWELTGEGVLGELSLGPLVGAATPLSQAAMAAPRSTDWTNEAAAGWGGDRWQLWQRGDSALVAWLTVWDSARDAEEFARALALQTSLRHRVADVRVAVVAGEVSRVEAELLERLLE